MILLKVLKLTPDARVPEKAHGIEAGYDLFALTSTFSVHQKVVTFGTGIAIEIPPGYIGLIVPRDTNYKTNFRLANPIGVIDPGSTGEILVRFDVLNNKRTPPYIKGDRIAKLLIIKNEDFAFKEVDYLSGSDRGDFGFGISGK